MVTMRSPTPCCGHNCVELKGEDLWSYSPKTESVSLRKCPYDHKLTNKAYLSAIPITSIFQNFTYKMAAKTSWQRNYVTVTVALCMSACQGSAVPCRLLHTGHRCCRRAASQVSLTPTGGGATTSAIHCWTPSIGCAQPHCLELLAGRPPRSSRAQQDYESFR